MSSPIYRFGLIIFLALAGDQHQSLPSRHFWPQSQMKYQIGQELEFSVNYSYIEKNRNSPPFEQAVSANLLLRIHSRTPKGILKSLSLTHLSNLGFFLRPSPELYFYDNQGQIQIINWSSEIDTNRRFHIAVLEALTFHFPKKAVPADDPEWLAVENIDTQSRILVYSREDESLGLFRKHPLPESQEESETYYGIYQGVNNYYLFDRVYLHKSTYAGSPEARPQSSTEINITYRGHRKLGLEPFLDSPNY